VTGAAHPLIVVGLDGATFNIIKPLLQSDQLPNIKRIMESGLSTELESTQPTATLPAWSSFLTGANPGTHGIIDMFRHVPGTYDLTGFHGGDRLIPTCLKHLSKRGYRVASVGIPGTFPPEKINGVCISGFDAPGGDRVGDEGIWPESLRPLVHELGGWRLGVFNEHSRDPKRLEKAAQRLLDDIGAKEKLLQTIYRQEPWDLFMFHLQASDTASHHAWHTWDMASPRACSKQATDTLPSIYRRLDELIGWFDRERPKDSRILIVSDHGFGGASDYAIHLNRWLETKGHLKFSTEKKSITQKSISKMGHNLLQHLPHAAVKRAVDSMPMRLKSKVLTAVRGGQIDHKQSDVFSDELDYAPTLWMHRKSRFKNGTLTDQEADSLRDQLAKEVLSICHPETGEPFIAKAHRKEEVLTGPAAGDAPDLILEPAWPSNYRASFLRSVGPGPIIRRMSKKEYAAPKGSGMPGVHHKNGVWIASGAGLQHKKLPLLTIEEAGSLIYALMGEPIPQATQATPPVWMQGILAFERSDREDELKKVSENESIQNSSVLSRLHAMGYLD
jgi:predicted AlkP superfamily phosphohydrolase/phosphomutase